MKILVLCMMLHQLGAEATERWIRWDVKPRDTDISFDREETLENEYSPYSDKLLQRLEGLSEQVKRVGDRNEYSSPSRYLSKRLCICETLYDIRDLGEGYYPRYLTASRCNPTTCQGTMHSCKLLRYKIYVLSLRDNSGLLSDSEIVVDNESQETLLPEPLRHKWKLQRLSVAVGCVPRVDTRDL